MSENKFTPGPWVAINSIPEEGYECFWINAQPHKSMRGFTKEIASVNGPQNDANTANAVLIAAAPELLQSNEWLLEAINLAMKGKPIRDLDEMILFAQRTIAKAKGES